MSKILRKFRWPIAILGFFVMNVFATAAYEANGFPRWPWVTAYCTLCAWLLKSEKKDS